MILIDIRNSYILRPKLPKTPIFLAKIILYYSYNLGKTWLTACMSELKTSVNSNVIVHYLRDTIFYLDLYMVHHLHTYF